MKENHTVIILAGSNLGNRWENIQDAIELVSMISTIESKSSLYETEAWGNENQQSFLNQALIIQSEFEAEALLNELLLIENKLGRVRNRKWEPRVIDLDILFFDDEIIQTSNLTVPHPEIQNRKFVLEPLCELIPGFIHPVLKKSVLQLRTDCNDKLEVRKLNAL